MKLSPTLIIMLGSLSIFLSSSYLPMPLLNLLVGNKAGAAVLLIANLFILRKNIVLGLAVFLAIASLFLEHRRRTVRIIQETMKGAMEMGAPIDVLDKNAPDLIEGEKHPAASSEHSYDDYNFEPSDHSKGGENQASPSEEAKGEAPHIGIGESIDEKAPLGTVPSNPESVSDFFQQRGLARPFEADNSF
jgi:hypothetical protein